MRIALYSLLFSILAMFFAAPLGWLIGRLVRKLWVFLERVHWSRHNVIYAEYESPNGLKPGEIAYLYDRVFGEQELLATLFDLELRKKVELSTLSSNRSGPDFKIQAHCEVVDTELLNFEQEVIATIKSYSQNATWSLLKTDTAVWDSSIELELQTGLQQKGYIKSASSRINAYLKYFLIGAAISSLFIILPLFIENTGNIATPGDTLVDLQRDLAIFTGGMLWLIASALYGIAAYFGFSAYYNALDVGKGTQYLRKLWPHMVGFREYLRVVEQDRIQFENSTLKYQARQKALPHAVALNLTTRWQERFQ